MPRINKILLHNIRSAVVSKIIPAIQVEEFELQVEPEVEVKVELKLEVAFKVEVSDTCLVPACTKANGIFLGGRLSFQSLDG